MSERGFFSASNDIKTLDGNIFFRVPVAHDSPNCRQALQTSRQSVNKNFGCGKLYHAHVLLFCTFLSQNKCPDCR